MNYPLLTESTHIPVMLNEVIALLAPKKGGCYIDATFGAGGYSKAILSATPCNLWAIDRDPEAILRGKYFAKEFPSFHLIQGEFANMDSLLSAQNVTGCDGIVMDVGVSSYQIDDADRGFSFRFDGPLDMRMSKKGPTAADLVNTLPEKELANLLWTYGEERFSRRIAKAIVNYRQETPIQTTQQLANLVRTVIPSGNKEAIDPATRTFQALRIEVNDELNQIQRGLDAALKLLNPSGRLIIVSFHSLEDRIVKNTLNQAAGRVARPSRHSPVATMQTDNDAAYHLLTNKPQRPTEAECRSNPRARSARLRAIERLFGPKEERRFLC